MDENEPHGEQVYVELGFPMPSGTADPHGVNIRIYEQDKCHVIAELRLSREALADLLAARGRFARLHTWRP